MWNTLKFGFLFTILFWAFCDGQGYPKITPDNPLVTPTQDKFKPEDSAPAADTTDTKVVQTADHLHHDNHDDHHHHNDHHHHHHGEDGKYDPKDDGTGWDIRKSVPGEPNTDYPVYHKIPSTGFTCSAKPPGYYADTETRCQAFRVCTTASEKAFTSFLCPNGSLFNQYSQTCDWWQNVDCKVIDLPFRKNNEINMPSGNKLMEVVQKMLDYPFKNRDKDTRITQNFLNDNQIQETEIKEYLPPGQIVTLPSTKKYYTPTVPAPVYTQATTRRATPTYLPPLPSTTKQFGTYPKPQPPAIVYIPPKIDTTTRIPTPSAIYVPAKPISPALAHPTTPKPIYEPSLTTKFNIPLTTSQKICDCDKTTALLIIKPPSGSYEPLHSTHPAIVTQKPVTEPFINYGTSIDERFKKPDVHQGYNYDAPLIQFPSRTGEIKDETITKTTRKITTEYETTTTPRITTTYRTTYPTTTTYTTTYPPTTTYRTTPPTTTTYRTTNTPTTTYRTTTIPTTTYRTTTSPTTTYRTTTTPTTTYRTTTTPTTTYRTTTSPTTTYRPTTYPTTPVYSTTTPTTTTSERTTQNIFKDSEPTKITLFTDIYRNTDQTEPTKYDVKENIDETPATVTIQQISIPTTGPLTTKPSDYLIFGNKPQTGSIGGKDIDIREGGPGSIVTPFKTKGKPGYIGVTQNKFGGNINSLNTVTSSEGTKLYTNTPQDTELKVFGGFTNTFASTAGTFGTNVDTVNNQQDDLTFLITNDGKMKQVLDFSGHFDSNTPVNFFRGEGLGAYASPKPNLDFIYNTNANVHEQNLALVGLTNTPNNKVDINLLDKNVNQGQNQFTEGDANVNTYEQNLALVGLTNTPNKKVDINLFDKSENQVLNRASTVDNKPPIPILFHKPSTETSTQSTTVPTIPTTQNNYITQSIQEQTQLTSQLPTIIPQTIPTTQNIQIIQTTPQEVSTGPTVIPNGFAQNIQEQISGQVKDQNEGVVQINQGGEREQSISLLNKGVLTAENGGLNQNIAGQVQQELTNQDGNQDNKYSISITKSQSEGVIDGPLVEQELNLGINQQQANQQFALQNQEFNLQNQQFSQGQISGQQQLPQPVNRQQFNQQNIEGQFVLQNEQKIRQQNAQFQRNQQARILNQGSQQNDANLQSFGQQFTVNSGEFQNGQNGQSLGQSINTGFYNLAQDLGVQNFDGTQYGSDGQDFNAQGFSEQFTGQNVDIIGSKPVYEFNYGNIPTGQGYQANFGNYNSGQNIGQDINNQNNFDANSNSQNLGQSFNSQSSFSSNGNTQNPSQGFSQIDFNSNDDIQNQGQSLNSQIGLGSSGNFNSQTGFGANGNSQSNFGTNGNAQNFNSQTNSNGNQNLGAFISQNFQPANSLTGQNLNTQSNFGTNGNQGAFNIQNILTQNKFASQNGNNQNFGISADQIQNFNSQTITGQTDNQKIKYKESVHVEIVPSLGFSFDSDAGRKEYISTVLGDFQNVEFGKDGSTEGDINGKIALSDVAISSYNGPSSYLVPQSSVLSLPSDAGVGIQGLKRNTKATKEAEKTKKKEEKTR